MGANSPEDYGDYFAWGETAPKETYNWSPYKWCYGSARDLSKYCTNTSCGTVDNKTELDSADDAAYVNWGEDWRMPTLAQQKELLNNCTRTWMTLNGVNGTLVTGPNGNTIFLPATGYRWDAFLSGAGSYGYYWSRTLDSSYPNYAYGLYCGSGQWRWFGDNCDRGFAVRAVRVS